MSRFNNKCYRNVQNPKKMAIFIHGYNGRPEAIDYAVQDLAAKLNDDTVVVVPQAPEICEKDAANLQWLSFYEVDPTAEFRNPAVSTEDIVEIFNKLSHSFSRVAKEINLFVDEMQAQFGITDENTYLVGFSQGAMLSLYASLIRPKEIGGCVMNAGIVAGKDLLEKEMCSKPRLILLHGQDDVTVQYKTLPYTLDWLIRHGLNPGCKTYPNLAHRMCSRQMQDAADFINS